MTTFGSPDGKITGHTVKFAVGGMRFDHEIEAGWQISPSLGLVAKDVDRLGLEIENMREPITRSIVQVMIPSIRKNFETEGRPPWVELADYTKNVRGESGPILTRTGKLKRGVTKLHIWTIKDDSATIISLPPEIWYGAVHQSGYGGFAKYLKQAKAAAPQGTRPAQITQLAFKLLDKVSPSRQAKISIPQRRFLMFQEDDVDDILQIFAEWLEDECKKVGRFDGRSVRTVWGGPSF